MKSNFYFLYLWHIVPVSHDPCQMPDEEHLTMEFFSDYYLILFEGVYKGHSFCILLLPNGTVPVQQTMHPFKNVIISVVYQAEVMLEVQECFKESSFPATAWMEDTFYPPLLMINYSPVFRVSKISAKASETCVKFQKQNGSYIFILLVSLHCICNQ